MNVDKKTRNIFTLIVIGLFLVFSYVIVNSYYGETKTKKTLNHTGPFSFMYDISKINEKSLNEMYDSTRTNKVVLDKNYTKVTNDVYKGKIFVNPTNIDYYFVNENNGYKLSFKKEDYLTVNKFGDNDGVLNLIILGTDLKYYKIKISINKNTDKMDLNNKNWVKGEKSVSSIYVNNYYKVIDNNCNINIEFPSMTNEEKYSDSVFGRLIDKIEKSISIEPVNDIKYNYYLLTNDDIKLDKKTKLILSDKKERLYLSSSDSEYDYSLTVLTLIDSSDKYITIAEIDNFDNYCSYYDKVGYRKNYKYKDYNTWLVKNNGSEYYGGIIFEINKKYYLVNNMKYSQATLDNSKIDEFINTYIDGVLEIK